MKRKSFYTLLLLFAAFVATPALHGQTFSSDPMPDTPIPDNGCPSTAVSDTISVSGVTGTLGTDVFLYKVCLNITHPEGDDIEVRLESPDGTTIELMTNDGDGPNFVNTCFSMQADDPVFFGDPPFTGLYEPDESFANFDGISPNGIWILHTCDDYSTEEGTFDDWEMVFVDVLCETPQNVVTTPKLGETEIRWASNGAATAYLLEYGPDGFSQGNGTKITVSDTMVVLDMLAAGTAYDIYLHTICDMDTIGYTRDDFTTSCDAISGGYFEPIQVFGTYNFPDCWRGMQGGAQISDGPITEGITRWDINRYGNRLNATPSLELDLFVEDNIDWMVSPFFDLTDGDHKLSFDMALQQNCIGCYYEGDSTTLFADDTLGIAISLDSGETWQIFAVWDSSDIISPYGQTEVFSLVGYAGAIQLAFFASDGSVFDSDQRHWYIDNFRLVRDYQCDYPTNLQSSYIDSSTTDLSWQENGNATMWEIEIGERYFDRTGIPTHTTSANPFSWDETVPGTEYEFFVRSKYGTDSTSSWSDPNIFCTLIDTFTWPFDDIYPAIYDCWIAAIYNAGGSVYVGPHALGEYGWILRNAFSSIGYMMLALPDFYYHPGSDYTIQFKAKGAFDLVFGYIPDIQDESSFIPVDTFVVEDTFKVFSHVDTFSGMGRLAFKTILDGQTYRQTAIDDFVRSRTGGGDPCDQNIVVSGTPASDTYRAGVEIQSDATILNGRNVIFEAGDHIDLLENFEVEAGAVFKAAAGVPCPN